jgi:hypothetical protein
MDLWRCCFPAWIAASELLLLRRGKVAYGYNRRPLQIQRALATALPWPWDGGVVGELVHLLLHYEHVVVGVGALLLH